MPRIRAGPGLVLDSPREKHKKDYKIDSGSQRVGCSRKCDFCVLVVGVFDTRGYGKILCILCIRTRSFWKARHYISKALPFSTCDWQQIFPRPIETPPPGFQPAWSRANFEACTQAAALPVRPALGVFSMEPAVRSRSSRVSVTKVILILLYKKKRSEIYEIFRRNNRHLDILISAAMELSSRVWPVLRRGQPHNGHFEHCLYIVLEQGTAAGEKILSSVTVVRH